MRKHNKYSTDMFRELVKRDIVSQRQSEAVEILYKHGPMSAGEATKVSWIDGLWKRYSELKRMGFARIIGEKAGPYGRMVAVWGLTAKAMAMLKQKPA